MRVLLLSPSFEDPGGVASFCRILMKNASPGFEIHHLEIGNRPGNRSPLRRLSFFFRDAVRLRRSLKTGAYDLVHLNPSMEILALLRDSFYLSRANRIAGMKSLVLFHGWNDKLAGRVLSFPALRSLFRSIYARAGKVLTLCRPFRDRLEDMGLASEKLDVVTTMFERNAGPAAARRGDPGPVQILFMARLWESKGVYIAMDVAKLLAKKGVTNFRMIIAGDGPELEGARRCAEEQGLKDLVFIPGYLGGDAKRKALETSDIFLYPTFYGEGCPVVLLEAMGAGLAIVSTPVAAIPEIVEEGANGFLVDSRRAEDFVGPVERLITDVELLRAMREANRTKASESYEASVVTAKIESLYREILGGLPAVTPREGAEGA